MTLPLPGWYQDPANPDQQKWWDGQNWSTYTMPLAAASSPGLGGPAAGEAAADAVASDSPAPPGPFSPVDPASFGRSGAADPASSEAPASAAGGAGTEEVPGYPGAHGYPGGREQGYPTFQSAPPQQSPGYTDPAAGYQGYQQGYAGMHPAYSGYPGYQGYPGYPQNTLRSNPLALTGFILGLVSLLMFFIPIVGTVIGLSAGSFSAIGLSNQWDRAPMYKVFGIIGLILGVIFTLLSLLVLVAVFADPYTY